MAKTALVGKIHLTKLETSNYRSAIMEAQLVKNLETLLACFRQIDGRAESTVGRFCAGDGDFFDRLRAGSTFSIRKYDQVVAWFASNWPTGAEWPEDVVKPEPAAEQAAG